MEVKDSIIGLKNPGKPITDMQQKLWEWTNQKM